MVDAIVPAFCDAIAGDLAIVDGLRKAVADVSLEVEIKLLDRAVANQAKIALGRLRVVDEMHSNFALLVRHEPSKYDEEIDDKIKHCYRGTLKSFALLEGIADAFELLGKRLPKTERHRERMTKALARLKEAEEHDFDKESIELAGSLTPSVGTLRKSISANSKSSFRSATTLRSPPRPD